MMIRGESMMLYRFGCREIEAAGYDAQCELLKIKFVCDGEIWQYYRCRRTSGIN